MAKFASLRRSSHSSSHYPENTESDLKISKKKDQMERNSSNIRTLKLGVGCQDKQDILNSAMFTEFIV